MTNPNASKPHLHSNFVKVSNEVITNKKLSKLTKVVYRQMQQTHNKISQYQEKILIIYLHSSNSSTGPE